MRGASARRPCRSTGIATRAATAATCASATARTAGPDSPPVPAAEPRLGRAGRAEAIPASAPRRAAARARRERHRAQRVDQRDGVRAALLGRLRARGDVGGVGRQLDDQRLCGARAHARARPARAGAGRRRCPVPSRTFGHDTFSSIAAISARASHASTSSQNSSALEPITFVISGTGSRSRAARGRVLGEIAARDPCSAARSS